MASSAALLRPRRPAWPARIAILALSGAIAPERLAAGVQRLTEQGCAVQGVDAAQAQWRYFAGDDAARLAALDAVLASDADLVLFGRGGYGLSRLLDRIDWARVADSGKAFCGYSDVTAFSLAALARGRFITFAGPVAAGDFAQSEDLAAREFTEAQFLAVLGANTHVYPRVTSDIDHGRAVVRGTLWGTNLAMISHLVGTPFMPAIDDGILLIEDIGEAPYRVERMLHQLRLAGILERQRAIVLGGFTDCDSAPGARFPYTMPEVVETLRQLVPCPVLTGFPFGHITAKVTLPMGAAAELTIDGADYTLAVRDYWRD